MFAIGDKEWPGISKLIEEIGECGQVCGKLMGTGGNVKHWDGEGNLDKRLIEEMADVCAAIRFVMQHNCMDREKQFEDRFDAKTKLFEQWHAEGRVVLDNQLARIPDPDEERCRACGRPRSAWAHQVGAAAYESCVFMKPHE